MKDQFRSALEGNTRAIARLLSCAESTGGAALELQAHIYPHTGNARLVGITGPAGAGKSTLISKLATKLAADEQKIAIIACDPSSPNTGGALLGDRIRMHELVYQQQVFVRSIATGDSTGGLPLAAFRLADVFDACGFDTIIIETVGTGQNQVDIMQAVHTVITVSAPGLGDDIQAMKSGLLEIADIHVVTKSDLTGAAKTLMEIEHAAHMRQGNYSGGEWQAAVIACNGLNGGGVTDLLQAIRRHQGYLDGGNRLQDRRRRMLGERVYREAIDILTRSFKDTPRKQLSNRIERVLHNELTPTQAARELIGK